MNDNPLNNDPAYVTGWNAALEYAAQWISSAIGGYGDETKQFALANAMSLRAAKREIEQQDFFEAVRNDPYMRTELKAYWLAMEPKQK